MSMGTYYIIYEHVSREIFRVEAESEDHRLRFS
jgi:hypothetical protein